MQARIKPLKVSVCVLFPKSLIPADQDRLCTWYAYHGGKPQKTNPRKKLLGNAEELYLFENFSQAREFTEFTRSQLQESDTTDKGKDWYIALSCSQMLSGRLGSVEYEANDCD